MTAELEQALAAAMQNAVADVRLDLRLLDDALGNHSRRIRRHRAAAGIAAAVAMAVAGATIITVNQPHERRQRPWRALDTAFVTAQVEQALTDDRDKIMKVVSNAEGDWTNTVYIDGTGGAEATDTTTASGELVGESYVTSVAGTRTLIVIDYQSRTWSATPLSTPTMPRHRTRPPQTADQVVAALRKGTVRVAGEGTMDGRHLLRLSVDSGLLPAGSSR